MALQISSTVPAQDDLLVPGTWLTCNYKVQSFLGEGTFGKVAKCVRMVDNRTGAIKVIKKRSSYEKQADAEVRKETGCAYQRLSCSSNCIHSFVPGTCHVPQLAALRRLKSLDLDKCNLVRWYQTRVCLNSVCFLLSTNKL